MGIERNNRKPKRRRTPSQRIRGRMKPAFNLPEKGAEPVKKKEAKSAVSDEAKPKVEKKTRSKTAAKKKTE